MFKIMVAGRTLEELRKNVHLFLNEIDGKQNIREDDGQLPLTALGAPDGMINAYRPEEIHVAPSAIPEQLSAPIPVPPAPVVMPTSSVNSTLDSRGVPWDERVHSSSKATNKDGSWRTRRGIEPAQLAKIEAELLAGRPAVSTASSQTTHQDPAPFVAPPVPQVVPPTPEIVAQPTPPPPQATQLPPMPPPKLVSVSGHTLETFRAQLVPTLAGLVNQGKLTNEYIQSLKSYFKVEQIWEVNEQQLAEMYKQFCDAGLIAQVNQ